MNGKNDSKVRGAGIILLSVPILLIAGMSVGFRPGAAEVKIGVIDVQRLVAESGIGKAWQARIRLFYDSKKSELDSKELSLKNEMAALENQRSVLSEEAYIQKKNELEARALAFEQERDGAEQTLQNMQRDEMEAFSKEVEPIVQSLGEERGFTIILDRAAGVHYYDKEIDLTQEVITRLEAESGENREPGN